MHKHMIPLGINPRKWWYLSTKCIFWNFMTMNTMNAYIDVPMIHTKIPRANVRNLPGAVSAAVNCEAGPEG